MPWCKGGADGQSLSVAVKSCIKNFGLQNKVIAYWSDGDSNLKTCKTELNKTANNAAVFNPPKPLFEAQCLAHVLSGAYKVAVVDATTDDGMLSVEETRQFMQKCVIWTKKSQKDANALIEAQEYVGGKIMKLLTPVKTKFGCYILSLRYMLKNRKAIDYLYGEKTGMSLTFKTRKSSTTSWIVAEVVVKTMAPIMESIKFNLASGSKWLLADAMLNLTEVCRNCVHAYVRQLKRRDIHAVDKWARMIIKTIIEFTRSMWKIRCGIVSDEKKATYEQRQRMDIYRLFKYLLPTQMKFYQMQLTTSKKTSYFSSKLPLIMYLCGRED